MKRFIEQALLGAMSLMVLLAIATAMTIDTQVAWFATLAVIGMVGALIYTAWRHNR